MKTLIIDCDGVLYPGWQFPLSRLISALEKQAIEKGINKEEYNRISKKTKERGEEGVYNFVLNLVGKNMDSFDEFCKKMINSMDYNSIKRDDELYELLIKTSKKYEICIFTNDCRWHLDKVYSKLFGKTYENFPFKSFDIKDTFKDGSFHPKQTADGYKIIMKKINKKGNECIICDDSYRNIRQCIENKFSYEYITEENTLKKVLNKLNQ